jgi:hypothetical protein
MPARCCGATRERGGIYAEVPTSPFGLPLEYFLVDPPHVVDTKALGLTPLGVKLLPDSQGVFHIWDIVGGDSYPNVTDMVEEIRSLGVSRRLSDKLDYKKLSPRSKIIMLHSRAFIENFEEYASLRDCPTSKEGHERSDKMCVKLWWEDITDGTPTKSDIREVARMLPSCMYKGLSRPEGVTPKYKLAIFASFTLGRLVVVRDDDQKRMDTALGAVRQSQLAVDVVDE